MVGTGSIFADRCGKHKTSPKQNAALRTNGSDVLKGRNQTSSATADLSEVKTKPKAASLVAAMGLIVPAISRPQTKCDQFTIELVTVKEFPIAAAVTL
jgi:hypothetical protein